MKNLKIIILFIMSLLMTFIFGCSSAPTGAEKGQKPAQKTISVYYSNKDSSDLLKKDISLDENERNDILHTVMNKLLENPKDEDIKSPLRSGTRCLWINNNEGDLSVNLSKEFYNEENVADIISVAAVVKSLCSVEFVDKVEITIEATPLLNEKGEKMGFMRGSDFVFDAEALNNDEENIVLYFSDSDGEYLKSEIRRISIPKGEVMEKVVVSELIKGPVSTELYKTIPEETKIKSVETKDGVCFVNLSSEFVTKHTGGSAGETFTVYSIVNSLTEIPGVNKVQFLIDGEKRNSYIHMVFNQPFERDVSLIRK